LGFAPIIRIRKPSRWPAIEVAGHTDRLSLEREEYVLRRIGPAMPIAIANDPLLRSDIGNQLRYVAEASKDWVVIHQVAFLVGRKAPVDHLSAAPPKPQNEPQVVSKALTEAFRGKVF
jgi:hypothetical protein